MIRIMLVDDHAAVRAGLQTVLEPEIDLVAVAATEGNEQLWPQFRRTSPDLVLLDYHLPGQSSLLICRRLKAMVPTPFVAFYSAYADATLSIPLRLAGADGLASKGVAASELFDVLRRVGRGEKVLPPVTRDLQEAAFGPLSPEDRVVAALLLDGATVADLAEVLQVDAAAVRVERLLGRVAGGYPGRAHD
jgi:DNA-binding NarL/FixJ family response regulator